MRIIFEKSQQLIWLKDISTMTSHTTYEVHLINKQVSTKLATNLTKYIMSNYQEYIIRRILSTFKLPEDKFNHALREITKDKRLYSNSVKNTLSKELISYFNERELNIKGIVNFKLYEYKKILSKHIESFLNNYQLNQEQNTLSQLINQLYEDTYDNHLALHIFHDSKKQQYLFYDEHLEIIDISYKESDDKFEIQNIILDQILLKLPKKIYLYTLNQRNEINQNISKLFNKYITFKETTLFPKISMNLR